VPFRVSYFFQQRAALTGGWSENFWSNETQLEVAKTRAAELAPLLSELHGHTSFITNYRVSTVAGFRQVFIKRTDATENIHTGASAVSDYPTNALLLKLSAAPDYKISMWVKGIWDLVVTEGGFFNPTATYIKHRDKFFAVLTNAAKGWAMRVQDHNQLFKVVQAITQAGIVTVNAHGYDPNDLVRITRARGLTQANGLWRVTVVDGNNFSLQGWDPPSPATPYRGFGFVRKRVLIYPSINGCEFDRATKHNVGRPFGLLSGKAKKRR